MILTLTDPPIQNPLGHKATKFLFVDKSSEPELGQRYTVIHCGKEHFEHLGIPEPKEGDLDYIEQFDLSIIRSALNNFPKNIRSTILVLRRVLLMKHLADYARNLGAQIMYQTSFTSHINNEAGQLAGAVLTDPDGQYRVNARLTVDASGIPAVVRTGLPDSYGVETLTTCPRDQFYVAFHYAKLKRHEKDRIEVVTTWPYYNIQLAPQHTADGCLVGVGANLSTEYAERVLKRFEALGYLPETWN
ncbi:MAG: hypothetical protein EZS28_029404 [Streblomastix strix]|uniref:FAD dependent oxidoreductase domain-containing protein n=1 Tax=Streblomastix strix TaxID=222440 RepID=A0A5J4UX67_9EUKA|nr:MAG: hypothetical protein EZS28_029404 [Streblomastix strix]